MTLQLQTTKAVREFDFSGNELPIIATGKTTMEMTVAASSLSMGYFCKLVQMPWRTAERRIVAFKDFQHIWMAFLSNTADSLWSKPGDLAAPETLVRLSQEGGHDVTFSGDGSMVFWLSGSSIFRVCYSL